jgi:hypothetical protein
VHPSVKQRCRFMRVIMAMHGGTNVVPSDLLSGNIRFKTRLVHMAMEYALQGEGRPDGGGMGAEFECGGTETLCYFMNL